MDAVTYPTEKVIETMDRHIVAVRVAHDAKPLAAEFNVQWTPALYILDSEGKRHMGSTGFLPPEEFIPWILLGRGRMHFDRNELDNAVTMFDSLSRDYRESDSAPEALFFNGVSKYKLNDEAGFLKEIYEQLRTRYPSSIWSKKALPYRLL